MFHFPHLAALVKNNSIYSQYFKNFTDWYNDRNKVGTDSLETQHEQQPVPQNDHYRTEKKIDTFDANNSEPRNLVHWKKKVQAKFEREVSTFQESAKVKDGKIVENNAVSLNGAVFDSMSTTDISSTECKICEKTFGNRRLLSQHKTIVHFSQSSSNEFCYLPFFAEPNQFDVKKHGKCTLECALCQKWFSGAKEGIQSYLEERKMKVKPKDGGRKRGRKSKSTTRRICELCSKILSNRKGLERHMLIHTGEKPFPCEICGKPFRRKDNCVRHKKTAHLFKKPRKPRRRRINNNNASPIIRNHEEAGEDIVTTM